MLKIIQKFINKNGLKDKVQYKGDHCFNKCNMGPNLMIGGKIYHQITEENINAVLTEALRDLIE